MFRLFRAIGTLLSGAVSWLTGSMGAAAPEAAYSGVIQEMKEKRETLVQATSKLIRLRDKKQQDLDGIKADLAKVEDEIAGATALKNETLLVMLIQKQESLVVAKAELEKDLGEMVADADQLKRDMLAFDGEIRKVMSEKERNIAKLRSAQARRQVEELRSEFSIDGTMQMLDGVREAIGQQVAEVNIKRELRGASLDDQLAKAREVGATANAQTKARALIAAHEARQGTAAAATPSPDGSGKTV